MNAIPLDALETTGWDDVLKETEADGKIVVRKHRRFDASENLCAACIGLDFAGESRMRSGEMEKLLEGSASKNVVELIGAVSRAPASRACSRRMPEWGSAPSGPPRKPDWIWS